MAGRPEIIMSRVDCISNRNTKIIGTYVASKLGHHDPLFDGLPFPKDRYTSPDDFYLNEDEWTTFDSFQKIFRKAKELVGEPYFYFNCGTSSANLRSWGRLDYFVRVFASPNDGFKRLPFFNKNFNDTKDMEVILPPSYDKASGKIRTILTIHFHNDFDLHQDYIGDPYLRGIVSSIPTIWGLEPAMIKQPLIPYDPEILFNKEPEFVPFDLKVREENNVLTLKDPNRGERKVVGKRILLEPEFVDGKHVFLGKYAEPSGGSSKNIHHHREAILITETVHVSDRIILKQGEIFKAPYFVLDILYDRLSLPKRLSQVFKIRRSSPEPATGLIETINQLRESIEARNKAYRALEKTNEELREAKIKVLDYAQTLEQKVEERTAELRKAKQELLLFSRGLEDKVNTQVKELEKYNTLRRYVSPKLADQILSSGQVLGTGTQRKMMTVLFSDIRNFSILTDSLEPEEIFHLLDKYLSEMTKLIHKYDGTLNKIIGDGLLVFLGDPIPMKDHAKRAALMCIDMQKKVRELREEWLQYGYELGVGMGINTGYMTVGNIGSDIYKDYTVIGNQVNVAARLESLAKPGQILISQRTYSRVRDLVEAEKVGEIKIKGIHNSVITYNVKGLRARRRTATLRAR
jgi:class 3 adenylate cyclase